MPCDTHLRTPSLLRKSSNEKLLASHRSLTCFSQRRRWSLFHDELDKGINYISSGHTRPLSLLLRGFLQDAHTLFSHAITFTRATFLHGEACDVQCCLWYCSWPKSGKNSNETCNNVMYAFYPLYYPLASKVINMGKVPLSFDIGECEVNFPQSMIFLLYFDIAYRIKSQP